jgi:hypothetical protein
MKNEIIHTLTNNFESHANQTEEGIEFWLAWENGTNAQRSNNNFIINCRVSQRCCCELI